MTEVRFVDIEGEIIVVAPIHQILHLEAESLNILKPELVGFLINNGVNGGQQGCGVYITIRSAIILLNGGAGSRGRGAYLCS